VEIVGRDRLGDLVADGVLTPPRLSAGRSPRRSARRLLETRVLTCAAPPTWPRTAARRIPATSARDGTNAFTTSTPSPAGRFTGSFPRPAETAGRCFGRLTVNNVGTVLDASAAGPGSQLALPKSPGSPSSYLSASPEPASKAITLATNQAPWTAPRVALRTTQNEPKAASITRRWRQRQVPSAGVLGWWHSRSSFPFRPSSCCTRLEISRALKAKTRVIPRQR
jgi:hypothetical protein